eukprot:Pgem_evm1s4902
MKSIFLALALTATQTIAYPKKANQLPNSVLIKANFPGLGHKKITNGVQSGGGEKNQFGLDFQATNGNWAALCIMDSDKDGRTNGEELGDPACTWVQGSNSTVLSKTITNPSIQDTNATKVGGTGGGGLTSAQQDIIRFIAETRPTLLRVHGAMMGLAWGVFVPFALLLVFLKKPLNKPVFLLHMCTMVLVVVMTIIAFAIILYANKQNEEYFIGESRTHGITGLALNGFLRPDKADVGSGTKKMYVRAWSGVLCKGKFYFPKCWYGVTNNAYSVVVLN